jgi:3-hydroxyisobutyrate dehydrogenase-like beta-hydroxyacid dehydrogenase
MPDRRIGFIGLGNMGEAIASNLVDRGIALTVFDLRPEPLDRLASVGAHIAKSVAEVARTCDQIHVVVVNDKQVRDVLAGEEGLFSRADQGTTVIVHSTVSPDVVRELAQLGSATGIAVLDAPVSGWVTKARQGSLTLMIGGPKQDVEACWPTFQAMGELLVHVGDVGLGSMAKLINNASSIISLVSAVEILRVASAAGIDEAVALNVMTASTGDTWALRNWRALRASMASYTTGPEGFGSVIYKDISLAIELAAELGVEVPTTAVVAQRVSTVVAAQ